jgi:predicted RNA binding protein YcfA (HicA-like mRNA interferase family)
MPKLPRVTAREICSVLEGLGFTVVRQSGSHIIYKNGGGKRATVPFHAGKILHPKVLKSILRRCRFVRGRTDETPVSIHLSEGFAEAGYDSRLTECDHRVEERRCDSLAHDCDAARVNQQAGFNASGLRYGS